MFLCFLFYLTLRIHCVKVVFFFTIREQVAMKIHIQYCVNMILVSCTVVSEDKLAMELHHVFRGNQQISRSKEMKRGKINMAVLICFKIFYSFAYNADIRTQRNQPKM